MRNIFSSSRYLEHYGQLKVTNHTTGYYAQVTFKESGYFSSAKNEIVGAVYNSKGEKLLSIGGRWDESLNKFKDSSPNNLQVIWRARPAPPNHQEMYGFTQFALELNELTPDLEGMLPNTDTRYRPDQRMYEQGRADEAELEKQRLEQKQRDYRKELESRGEKWVPRFFALQATDKEDGGSASGTAGMAWQFNGSYWEQRGKFAKAIELW
ncbi:hypothetical protein HK102_001098 [Quaeritorhiza haematococci]|nr:hypothetical protein HK102_001098 [Quaeritorhiza haematococci]